MKSADPKNKVERLLDQLINDYGQFAASERVFKEENVPAYLYNLFNGKYEFSYEDLKQLMALIKVKSTCKTDCLPS